MHALTLLITSLLVFALDYRFYAKFIITGNYLPKHSFQGNLNVALCSVMIVLVVIIFLESLKKIYLLRRQLFTG